LGKKMLVSSPFYGIFVVDLQKAGPEVKQRNMLPRSGSFNAKLVRAGIDRFSRCRVLVVGETGTAVVLAERLKEALRDGVRPHARRRAS